MRVFIGPEEFRQLTPWGALIDALALAFRTSIHVPHRLHVKIGEAGSMLVMPAWEAGGLLGLKAVQFFPDNSALGKPAIDGIYMLASANTGEVLAFIDAQELTARRTAAASALASRYLSRPDSQTLLVLGTGRLSFEVISAHSTTRPIRRVLIWGRQIEKARGLSKRVHEALGLESQSVSDLPVAIAEADIISTVTSASSPVLAGKYLRPGTHVDLIGGFTPGMREADDSVMSGASIYVDTEAALQEAGDLIDPLQSGVITRATIRGNLLSLCRGHEAKRNNNEITVFKSVGVSLEDLAAAGLAWTTRAKQISTTPVLHSGPAAVICNS